MKKVVYVLIIVALLVLVNISCSRTEKQFNSNKGSSSYSETNQKKPEFILKGIKNLSCVAQLTGKDGINKTDRYGVYGTDLGSMIEINEKIYMVFGDTFGPRSESQIGGGGENWRSNVMAVVSDNNPSDGLTFDNIITDEQGVAKELLSSLKSDKKEMTVIPTGGFSANGKLYLNFMSVKHWGNPGNWEANYAGLAVSEDQGITWAKLDHMRWAGDDNFIQVATYRIEDEIYFWGIPAGRFGGVKLMKVPIKEVEDIQKYLYFIGEEDGKPIWSAKPKEAKELVSAPVGELSVIWDKYLGRWIMTYLNEKKAAIEIREGIQPWGPWSEPIELVRGTQYPGLYGAYMHPKFVEEDGKVIYFAMSQWDPYNVFWMRAELEK